MVLTLISFFFVSIYTFKFSSQSPMTLTTQPNTWKAVRRSIVSSKFKLPRMPKLGFYSNLDDESFDDFRAMDNSEVENMLVEEMGILLMGDQTTNIRIETAPKFSMTVNPTADPHSRDLVMHFERIVMNCVTIRQRCERNLSDSGLSLTVRVVTNRCQALLSQELAEIVVNTTTPRLMEFYYQVMPMGDRLEIAAQILGHIADGDLVGGEVLTLLATRIRQNIRDDTSLLLHEMEQRTMATFMATLYKWISEGTTTSDTTMEFLVWNTQELASSQLDVLQRTTLPRDEKTDLGTSYRVLEELCPSQFSSVLLDIVKCGRYMHILKASSEEQERLAKEDVLKILGPYDQFIKLSHTSVKSRLIQARDSTSTRILKLLLEESSIFDLFDVVHCLFLCLDVSWLNLLMSEYHEFLMHRVKEIPEKRLNAIWRSVQMKRYDAYMDKFDLIFEPNSVLSALFKDKNTNLRWVSADAPRGKFASQPDNGEELSGWSGLSLRFKSPSLLAPLFTKTQMKTYSTVFRLIFACHLAIHQIGLSMLALPSLKDPRWRQSASLFSSINVQLHRFVEFWNLSVRPLVEKFKDDLLRARSIDEMATLHSGFLLKLGLGLRMNDPRVLSPIFALCNLTRQIYEDGIESVEVAEEQLREISSEIEEALCDSERDEQMSNEMMMMMTLGRC
ncbi:hypothetical protein PMAYCL1PPCAC_02867 [Pristionchus mayeri]|uniref:Gamma-tubulin complex component n=1 Tax=Pristionchus mayeri TaxID=1317129 RepID=A0AAN5C7D0_9BILA|nr:hypothetical protein PMAYCL1PPCAC_02867 [Pristionchus mayeri]